MKKPTLQTYAISLKSRILFARALVLLLAVASLSLFFANKNNNIAAVRASVTEGAAPVMMALSAPFETVGNIQNVLHNTMAVYEENATLRAENMHLKQWQSMAMELQNENEKLQTLLHVPVIKKYAYISGKLAFEANSPYGRSVVIMAGNEQGVKLNSAVINEQGMIGRIIEVNKNTSRILLLSDVNSRIPVISQTSRENMIIGGNNQENLLLYYRNDHSALKVGEHIITSSDGGVLPAGLPIGVVSNIDNEVVTVKPFVDGHKLEYVSVVDVSQ